MATTDLMFPPPKGGNILPLLRDDDKGNQNGNEKEHETADVVSMYHGNCGSEIARVSLSPRLVLGLARQRSALPSYRGTVCIS